MKKRYMKLKRIICCIMVAIILSGTIFFTIFQSQQLRYSLPQNWVDLTSKDIVWESDEVGYISSAYDMFDSVSYQPRMGFYGALMSPEGETIVEISDFVIVEKYLSEASQYLPDRKNIDRRIILIEEDFLNKGTFTYFGENEEEYLGLNEKKKLQSLDWSDIEITGTCDFNYIYPEKIKIKFTRWGEDEYVEYIPHENKTHLGTTTVSEWLEGYTYETEDGMHVPGNYRTEYITYTKGYVYKDPMKKWLNDEAKKISQKLYEETRIEAIENHGGMYGHEASDYNVFTARHYLNIASDNYYELQYMVVYHPILMVMEELWMVYIMIFIFTIISLIIISVIINKAYKQQLKNETNRQELTRGIAHELKTPLAITKGYIENWQYLGDKEKNETQETLINEIDNMNRMVTDFLELSHLEAKNKEIHWEEVDLYGLTQSVIRRLNPIIEERKLNVTVIPQEPENTDGFVVEADLQMIRTAIVNYVSNAIKYADKEIVIKLTEKSKSVAFDIENDGVTMDKKKLARIWDDFYKDSEYNRSSIGSSGLGLAITKNIFILHKAKYGCHSDNGKTRFTFDINKKRSI